MLETATTHPMIAVSDLGRAKEFYSGTLGLRITDERGGSAIRLQTERGTWFLVYQSADPRPGTGTCMRFEVHDVEATVARLRGRGIEFEEYDLPGIKTVDGIAQRASGARGAWFKDPDGNILEVGQYG